MRTPVGVMVPLGLMAILPATLGGCGETVENVTPVGGDQPSAVEIERYARRLHLDLAGETPDDEFLASAVEQLADGSAASRDTLVGDLLDDAAFAGVFVSELENRTFGGTTAEEQYEFLCGIIRGSNPECLPCGPPQGDLCGNCACAPLVQLATEREQIRSAAADFQSGTGSGRIERRYAASLVFRALLGDPGAQVTALFDVFLGRPPEADELRNAAAIAAGSLIPENPAGLLFHTYGSNYDDLIGIVFDSEVYREAVVLGVFQRYLGRLPSPVEAAHFSKQIAGGTPDLRPVIRAVVSSREYFEQ